MRKTARQHHKNSTPIPAKPKPSLRDNSSIRNLTATAVTACKVVVAWAQTSPTRPGKRGMALTQTCSLKCVTVKARCHRSKLSSLMIRPGSSSPLSVRSIKGIQRKRIGKSQEGKKAKGRNGKMGEDKNLLIFFLFAFYPFPIFALD